MCHGATPSGSIIENYPSRSADGDRDDLCFAGPEIPMLDAGRNRDVIDAVLIGPLQRCGCRGILALTGAHFVNDGVRNQDCGSEALDQIEAVNTGEQNEW